MHGYQTWNVVMSPEIYSKAWSSWVFCIRGQKTQPWPTDRETIQTLWGLGPGKGSRRRVLPGGLRVGRFSGDLQDPAQPRRASPGEGRDLTPTVHTVCFNPPALKSLLLISTGLPWALTWTWPNKPWGFMCLPLRSQYLLPAYWIAFALNFSDLFSIQFMIRSEPVLNHML